MIIEEVFKVLVGQNGLYGLCVIINNLNVVLIFFGSLDVEVIVVGGFVCNCDCGIVGEVMIDFMKQFCVDIGIIGVFSIDEDGMLFDYDYCEVCVVQVIIEQL